MNADAIHIQDALGGPTKTAELVKTSISTVYSWRSSGIPDSRLDHLILAAAARGKGPELEEALATLPSRVEPQLALPGIPAPCAIQMAVGSPEI